MMRRLIFTPILLWSCNGLLGIEPATLREAGADVGIETGGGSDGTTPDGTIPDAGAEPPSCIGLAPTCGPQMAPENCCASSLVMGGTFRRGDFDIDGGFVENALATVASFRLDKYMVTVARFRNFMTAVDKGWAPSAGSGKHAYLDAGGVTQVLDGGTTLQEFGWNPAWSFPTTKQGVYDAIHGQDCDVGMLEMTPNMAKEPRPINCVPWELAYAFCIWDGGFLPTDAEYNYAELGGSEQRVYPWSNPPSATTIDWLHASYGVEWYQPFMWSGCYGDPLYNGVLHPCGAGDITIPGSKPLGNGRWGQADLVGIFEEYVFDCYDPFPATCDNCASLISPCPNGHTVRSTTYAGTDIEAHGDFRAPEYVYHPRNSFRCARAP